MGMCSRDYPGPSQASFLGAWIVGADGTMGLEGRTLDRTPGRTSSEYPSCCWLCALSSPCPEHRALQMLPLGKSLNLGLAL